MTAILTRLKQIIADYFNPPLVEESYRQRWDRISATVTWAQIEDTTRAGTQL